MARINKGFLKYLRILGRRIYRPIRPLVSPLLKRVRLAYLLGGLVLVGLAGSLGNGWQVKGYERAAWWPWLAKSHAEMALEWFEAGDEKKALAELAKAHRLVWWETEGIKASLKRTEERVQEPERIRKEIESWEKVLAEKPYYRDVLLRLALLNYQIYENEKAQEYFEKAEYLDPNSQEVQKIGKIIFSQS